MSAWMLIFLLVALVAAIFAMGSVIAGAVGVAKVLFVGGTLFASASLLLRFNGRDRLRQ